MNTRSCLRWGLLPGMIAIAVACVAVVAVVYFPARIRAFNSRPLVLIHSPVNHEQGRVGEGVIVHATARENGGLRRIELWADDVFVDARAVTDNPAPTMLVFSSSWVPTAGGNHVLTVRAISSNGTEGQASVMMATLPAEGTVSGTHLVEEGETLESLAAEYETTPEEIAASNPGLDPAGLAPGDEIVIPDDEPPPAEGGAPAEEGGEPPVPEDDAPSALASVFELLGLVPLQVFDFGAAEPTGLRVEFLSLSTSAVYEQLHCYVGLANNSPRWYPDEDNDQTTDESFAASGAGAGGGMAWSIESLSGDSMPVAYWPRNRDLPVSVSCVGIAGGGTEALELGLWEEGISPDRWTGITLSGGVPGAYELTYRITRAGGGGGSVPLFLDTGMTSPSNARLDDRRISLRWDYDPRPDEEPIDGFRIYLNGNLQWVEPADSRESGLPYEWFNPPCGTTYTFNITAYRFGLPDGPESLPAIAIVNQPVEDCTREILVTFLTLETYDLGGDGHDPAHSGNVGPVYGDFFANDQQITFDTRSPGAGGSLDVANGLSDNTSYNLREMSADSTWRFNGLPAMLVDIPDGGTFEFGFTVMDDDSGRCDHSSDPGCDDLVCEGLSMIYYEDSPSGVFDQHNEGALISEDGRCRVTFQWGPAGSSPVGSGVPGWEPLPWLSLEDSVVNEDTGQVQLHVRNTGTATWPWRDLNIELQTRDGTSLGIYTWPGFVLEAGQRTVLEHPDMRLSAPFDACVVIDPYDAVLEEYERSGAMLHLPICPGTPDLVITNAHYEPIGGNGQIMVTIQNTSSSPLENRAVSVQSYLPDGTPLYVGGSWPNISLGRYETVTFGMGGVSESIRERMQGGYSVVVNPDGRIVESDTSNNTFVVSPMNNLMITVMSLWSSWDYRNSAEYRLTAYAVSGDSRRQVANLNFADPDWGPCTRDDGCSFTFYGGTPANSVYWFPIYGDELLEVSIRTAHRSNHWTVTDTYLPENNWDSNSWGSTRDCSNWSAGPPGMKHWHFDTSDGHSFTVTFQVCHQSAEP